MKTKRNTRISIETHRVLVISRPTALTQNWCYMCAASVGMITPEEAAAAAQVNSRTIYRWVEANRVHFTEVPEGSLLICLSSLTALVSTDGIICQPIP